MSPAAVWHTSEPDRVRARSPQPANNAIDQMTAQRLRTTAPADIARRIEELDREWDFERIVETEAASMGLAGLVLGVAIDRRFLVLPGFVTAMMLLHAIDGWYPLLPLLRRAGVRTEDEIARERYALKALRGDFAAVRSAAAGERADAAWRAVLA